MAYNDFIWIYDVNRQYVKEGQFPRYHAFRRPGDATMMPNEILSACGKVSTNTFSTKMAGGQDCEECLAVTGPDTSDEPEGDVVAYHAMPEEDS